jgi:hypothetical protein
MRFLSGICCIVSAGFIWIVQDGCCSSVTIYGSSCKQDSQKGIVCSKKSDTPTDHACKSDCHFIGESFKFFQDCETCNEEVDIYTPSCSFNPKMGYWACPEYSTMKSTSDTYFKCKKTICPTIKIDNFATDCCEISKIYGIDCVEDSSTPGLFACANTAKTQPETGTYEICTSTKCGNETTTVTDCYGGNSCLSETTYSSYCSSGGSVPGTYVCAGAVSLVPDVGLTMTCTRRPCGDSGLFYDCH